jgi:hypothetical protein
LSYTDAFLANIERIQSNCNHRKGGHAGHARSHNLNFLYEGNASAPYLRDEFGFMNYDYRVPIYAVIKHRLPIGGILVLCQRCGKEWHPADPVTGKPATKGWEQAVTFNTDNKTSASVQFYAGNRRELYFDV